MSTYSHLMHARHKAMCDLIVTENAIVKHAAQLNPLDDSVEAQIVRKVAAGIVEARPDAATDRLAALFSAAELADMERMTFGRPCGACGEHLPTEAAFYRHFVPSHGPTLRNLGSCPNKHDPR